MPLAQPLTVTVLKSVVLYIVMLVMVRVLGKRAIGNFTAFDLLVALMVSDMIGDIVFGGVSFAQGMAGILPIAAMEYAGSWLSVKKPSFDRVIEGSPTVVVREGELDRRGMNTERMTEYDVDAALRHHGIDDRRQVRLAAVESDGHVSVLSYSPR
jgi:uncharacterized membrane protein YcaP (DUF421 family)